MHLGHGEPGRSSNGSCTLRNMTAKYLLGWHGLCGLLTSRFGCPRLGRHHGLLLRGGHRLTAVVRLKLYAVPTITDNRTCLWHPHYPQLYTTNSTRISLGGVAIHSHAVSCKYALRPIAHLHYSARRCSAAWAEYGSALQDWMCKDIQSWRPAFLTGHLEPASPGNALASLTFLSRSGRSNRSYVQLHFSGRCAGSQRPQFEH